MFDWITIKGMIFMLGAIMLGLQLFLDWRMRRLIINDNHALNEKLVKIVEWLNRAK